MASIQDLLLQRQLEGEKLRTGTLKAGEQILPQVAANELQQQQTLPAANLRNALAGSNLQNTQQNLAQRFLSGGGNAPLDVGSRETLESGLRDALIQARSLPRGGAVRDAQTQARVGHAIGRSELQGQANKRLFTQLSANLNPGLPQVGSSVLGDAQTTATGGTAGVATAATIQQAQRESVIRQQQKDDENLLAAITSIGKSAAEIFSSIF